MKKNIKRLSISAILILTVLFLVILGLYFNEIRSLASLKKVDEYPMYQMTYYGDYGFDEFLNIGAKSDSDIERFVTKRLLKGMPIDLGVTGDGCTAFVTRNEKGEIIYGRNFDFTYTPSVQVKTKPKNGYESISTVNLTYAGYSKDKLPHGLSFDSFLTLAAPYLPFDGINEKGVAIALLAVPEVDYTSIESKVTLNTTTAIRLVLDKAANVDEAVKLLKKYNIYFSGGIDCHYLIADASGKSVLVEYWDGEVKTITVPENYQIASNFVAYDGLNIGEGGTEFDRYNRVKGRIEENGGILTELQAIDLLIQVGVYSDSGEDKLQWTVLYNLTTLNGNIFAYRNKDNIINFQLDKTDDSSKPF